MKERGEQKSIEENEFLNFLEVRVVEAQERHKKDGWSFAVTENFRVYITSSTHERLSGAYGVDLDRTLTEGYLSFDETGRLKEVRFKPPFYQKQPAFGGDLKRIEQLKSAVRTKIKEALSEDTNTKPV